MRIRTTALLIGAVLAPLALSRSHTGYVGSGPSRPGIPPAAPSAQGGSQTVGAGEARVRPREEGEGFAEFLRTPKVAPAVTHHALRHRADGGGWHPWSDRQFRRERRFR